MELCIYKIDTNLALLGNFSLFFMQIYFQAYLFSLFFFLFVFYNNLSATYDGDYMIFLINLTHLYICSFESKSLSMFLQFY